MNNIPHIVDTGASPIEPAGWIGYQEGHLVSFLKTQQQVNSFLTATDPTGRVEPVYTHPVKEQLTDEEIIKVYEDMLGVASAKGSAIDFARAILKKASEK